MAKSRRIIGGIKIRTLPPVSAILKEFDYDPERCEFLFKPDLGKDRWADRWNKKIAGTPAGYTDAAGYRRIRVRGQSCATHRLVWKINTGKDPTGLIDHINGIRDDNRFENLRDVTPRENALNAVRGRWIGEIARRREQKEAERRNIVEARERKLLARLKAKYENGHEDKTCQSPADAPLPHAKPLSMRAIEQRDERDAALSIKT